MTEEAEGDVVKAQAERNRIKKESSRRGEREEWRQRAIRAESEITRLTEQLAEVEAERDRIAALKMDDADAAMLRAEAKQTQERAEKAEDAWRESERRIAVLREAVEVAVTALGQVPYAEKAVHHLLDAIQEGEGE